MFPALAGVLLNHCATREAPKSISDCSLLDTIYIYVCIYMYIYIYTHIYMVYTLYICIYSINSKYTINFNINLVFYNFSRFNYLL